MNLGAPIHEIDDLSPEEICELVGSNNNGHVRPGACEKKEPDEIEVAGELPPLLPEGPRIAVCIAYELRQTRFGLKHYLFWKDENAGFVLPQYFRWYKKYPVNSKAVTNYIVGTGTRPARLDRITLRHIIGLRAEVQVETARPTYTDGVLKGHPLPEACCYSKVTHILRPLARLDLHTLSPRGETER